MKFEVNSIISILCLIASFLWGGFPTGLIVLAYFALVDYFTGMYAAFIKKEWSSRIGALGIGKKIFMFMVCSVAYWIDNLTHANNVLFNIVVFWYCGNEALSILENAIKIDLPIPQKLKDAVAQLKEE